ncbi:MAG: hypothetical protein KDH15_15720 [Rhodocyclaceae bacterium]|nr:hypothetical protein [Rhodocyclaceae bacterium]
MKLYKFPPKRPGEIVAVRFPYSRELSAGETLTGAPTVAISVRTGADPAAAAMLVGAPVVGADDVVQLVGAGVDLAQYLLTCLADTTAGQRLQREAILPVADPR